MDYAGKSFILLHKKFKEWEWYDNPPTRLVFEHCLLSVNYEDENWRGQKIKRGQFPTSVEKIATANGLTIQQTRTALNNLQITNEITIQTTNRYSIITVNNWDLYQPEQQTKKRIRQQTNNKPTNKQNGGSNNNTYNNINNSNNIISSSSLEEILNKISKEEEEELKKIAKENKKNYFRPWLRKIIDHGDIQELLQKAKARIERRKQKEISAATAKIEEIQEPQEVTEQGHSKAKAAFEKLKKIRR